MNIAHIEEQSFIYGPGCRFVIWTQGCSIRCKECWNQEMWDFNPKIILSVSEIFDKILAEKEIIEGITILGGEPLDQIDETIELLRMCQDESLTTMLFTGYEIGEIKDNRLFELCDILITGRFDLAKRTLNHQWIGSTNQEIHFLTSVHKNYELENANYLEIDIDESGQITVLGFPRTNNGITDFSPQEN